MNGHEGPGQPPDPSAEDHIREYVKGEQDQSVPDPHSDQHDTKNMIVIWNLTYVVGFGCLCLGIVILLLVIFIMWFTNWDAVGTFLDDHW